MIASVGDEVVISHSFGKIKQIARVTATSTRNMTIATDDGARWCGRTGTILSGRGHASGCHIRPATEADKITIERGNALLRIVAYWRSVREDDDIPIEQIRRALREALDVSATAIASREDKPK